MPAVVAHDAFRAARGAGGVQNVERRGCRHRDTGGRLRAADRLAPVEVAVFGQRGRRHRPLIDDAVLGLVRRHLDGAIEQRLVFDHALHLDAA